MDARRARRIGRSLVALAFLPTLLLGLGVSRAAASTWTVYVGIAYYNSDYSAFDSGAYLGSYDGSHACAWQEADLPVTGKTCSLTVPGPGAVPCATACSPTLVAWCDPACPSLTVTGTGIETWQTPGGTVSYDGGFSGGYAFVPSSVVPGAGVSPITAGFDECYAGGAPCDYTGSGDWTFSVGAFGLAVTTTATPAPAAPTPLTVYVAGFAGEGLTAVTSFWELGVLAAGVLSFLGAALLVAVGLRRT